jgi:hypothetical protein
LSAIEQDAATATPNASAISTAGTGIAVNSSIASPYDQWKKTNPNHNLYSQFYLLLNVISTVTSNVSNASVEDGSVKKTDDDDTTKVSANSIPSSTSTIHTRSVKLVPVGSLMPQVSAVSWDADTGLVAVVVGSSISIFELREVNNDDDKKISAVTKPGTSKSVNTPEDNSISVSDACSKYELVTLSSTDMYRSQLMALVPGSDALTTHLNIINVPGRNTRNISVEHLFWAPGGHLIVSSIANGDSWGCDICVLSTLFPHNNRLHSQQHALTAHLHRSSTNDVHSSSFSPVTVLPLLHSRNVSINNQRVKALIRRSTGVEVLSFLVHEATGTIDLLMTTS